ncbi:MarR family winged helix-turn-helix transcriptional regulator [Rhizobium leguminosarum]|jgi:DNA-binding MarR family transcriptional regulator|uniref:MarR family winged helix-turn-helix transcriptional regulator n=1 Tax=Rhizobium leguminosarum TaxID=384 RepID=UPI00038018A9|nr:MarR family winged helix-turn-helix transcriptional regulator [Rhizobium leguminosarum]ASR09568.1 MarR family transcriptional regulator [Rhizobium leguminosarum bv. viciae]MBY5563857.1 winged helix-turn-helix transcriptional regulator [Rhizobium leguminosarum]MBY5709995.1 winged helix-turn-helix transcriptional regulator [Rhizobium leguminosarum]MBY5823896.1 winged helix-turn-helix transcriptional regulator [Rhizobium leguminosarum]NKN00007.1 MarR family transcriptional regulator [Rhizobium
MREPQRTPAGTALTDLILDLFRLNNRMINAGDKLVDGLGLTSARWQVLGTVVTAGRPQPVAWLARDMGANRQNVQRIVNDLEKEGLLAFQPNPHHRRAQLVVLTDKGEQAYKTAMRLQAPWVDMLSQGLQVEDLKIAHAVMKALRSKLEGHGDVEEQA